MKPKSKKSVEKGEVALWIRGGMLWLRWRFQKKQYSLSLGLPDTPFNRFQAQEAATGIKKDINYGNFNPSELAKYKPQPLPDCSQNCTQLPKQSTVSTFEAFVQHRQLEGTSGQAIASRYKPMVSNLKRFKRNIEEEATAREFVDVLRSRQSPLIANQNLALLKGFGVWAVEFELMASNPFAKIKPLKVDKSRSRVKPFTQEEINRFLATIKTDRYYWQYHDFCMALFYLGLRPSEAIGLRWKQVDFVRRQITICESLSRSPDGKTAGYTRQRKGTKTSNGSRVLDMTDKLYDTLLGRKPADASSEDLVFTSPTGKPIDDHAFSQRCWKRICQKAGIEHRSPYNSRHSLLSHLIESGATLPQAAYVAGHKNTRMVAETYGHMINRPKMVDF